MTRLPAMPYLKNKEQGKTLWTEALYSVLTTRGIRLFNAPDLREHVLNAVSVETPRGIRLSKQKTSNKIDAAVALSFAVLAAIQAGRPFSPSDYANYKPPEVISSWDPRFPVPHDDIYH